MTANLDAAEGTRQSVVAFGELLWDLLPTGKVLGGAPANFAYRLRSLGNEVALISRLGADALGEEARTLLQDRDMPLQLVQTDSEHPTGTVPVTLTSSGIPRFTIVENVAYDYIELSDVVRESAATAALICFGTLVQRSPVTRETLYRFLELAPQATKLLDINLRENCYSPETVQNSLERADILKLNDSEVQVLSEMLALPTDSLEQFAQGLFERFEISQCLITLGEQGVQGYSRAGEKVEVPGKSVTVVDTIGSGDAFTAGFVHEYLKGSSLERCCAFGNAVGAAVATVKGGMSPVEVSL